MAPFRRVGGQVLFTTRSPKGARLVPE